MKSEATSQAIYERLQTAFNPTTLQVIDDYEKHQGHEGAKTGGHFTVQICAQAFANQNKVTQHRLIYAALGDLMVSQIHALAIFSSSPT